MAKHKVLMSVDKMFDAIYDTMCELSSELGRACENQMHKAAHSRNPANVAALQKSFDEYASCLQALYYLETIRESTDDDKKGDADEEADN